MIASTYAVWVAVGLWIGFVLVALALEGRRESPKEIAYREQQFPSASDPEDDPMPVC